MKISKSLLSAITAGVLMTTTISCEKTESIDGLNHSEMCTEDCKVNHKSNEQTHTDLNCPACGMG